MSQVKLQLGERGYVKLQPGERGNAKLESTQKSDEPFFYSFISPLRSSEKLAISDWDQYHLPIVVVEEGSKMPGKVTVKILEGSTPGKEFVFEEHDTLLFGRAPDCHVSLPDDSFISRFHFILEASPPRVRLRDLGSLNGTFVNGNLWGGQESGSLSHADKEQIPQVDLRHGDRIRAGKTVLEVTIDLPDETMRLVLCVSCGGELPGTDKHVNDGRLRCERCRARTSSENLSTVLAEDVFPEVEGYAIEGLLGHGGMGIVYLVRRVSGGDKMALKILSVNTALEEKARRIFKREMQTLQRLRHPNIVEFIDSRLDDEALHITMEYCNRGSVHDLLEKHNGGLEPDVATAILLQTLKGLEFAHGNNFVHRDIKPKNILLRGTGKKWRAKLADFGLAKNLDKVGLSGLTATGSYGGTAHYMPREQLVNFKYVQPSSDVWSAAATFYTLVTGDVPRLTRPGQDPIEAILEGTIIPIQKRQPDFPGKIAKVIDKALDNEPKERYPTAIEFRQAVKAAL